MNSNFRVAMKTFLQLLVRYGTFLLFLALECVALVMLVRGNRYQRSAVLSSANRIAAETYAAGKAVTDYFRLQKTNEDLQAENTDLLNRINELENKLALTESIDSNYVFAERSLKYVGAKVVNLNTKYQHNYITINKGRRDGLRKDMGVRDKDGVVGVVSAVSDKFATVIPILNTRLNISCKFKKNDYVGTLHWDGRDYRFAELLDIARHIEVAEGDTLVTSGYSSLFPAGIAVGYVEEVSLPESEAYYKVRVRLAVDFKRLHYVNVIVNHNADEMAELESLSNKGGAGQE